MTQVVSDNVSDLTLPFHVVIVSYNKNKDYFRLLHTVLGEDINGVLMWCGSYVAPHFEVLIVHNNLYIPKDGKTFEELEKK